MKIINDQWAYGADSHNFILYRRRDPRDLKYGKDKTAWKENGFYASLHTLIRALLCKVQRKEIDDLLKIEEFCEEFKEWVGENVPNLRPDE